METEWGGGGRGRQREQQRDIETGEGRTRTRRASGTVTVHLAFEPGEALLRARLSSFSLEKKGGGGGGGRGEGCSGGGDCGGGGGRPSGSPAPDQISVFAVEHTLDFALPSLLAVTGTGSGGGGQERRLGAPGSRREELGERSGGSGQSEMFLSPFDK